MNQIIVRMICLKKTLAVKKKLEVTFGGVSKGWGDSSVDKVHT